MFMLLYCSKVHEAFLVISQLNLFFVGLTDVGETKCPRLLQISELESKPTVSLIGTFNI